jgi:hypothetical protein
MWRVLCESVRGPSHERTGQPCQDACLATRHAGDLILVASDGAGSAALSHVGSALACSRAVELIRADLDDGLPVHAIERDTALSWLLRLQRCLADEAATLGTTPGEMACTLLLAVVGETAAAFAQVGDGCIVTLDAGAYSPVFWPQTGEYANTTFFITEEEAARQLDFSCVARRVDELAVMTDGVQSLALSYAERSAHQPFFRPMFARLRRAGPGECLAAGLRAFLGSQAVQARSDDDKTLILATRASHDGSLPGV